MKSKVIKFRKFLRKHRIVRMLLVFEIEIWVMVFLLKWIDIEINVIECFFVLHVIAIVFLLITISGLKEK